MRLLLIASFVYACLLPKFVAAQEKTPMPVIPSAKTTQEDKSPHKSNFVTVNGVKLHYLDWGGKGEALLFIHGDGGNAHTFDEMAPKFTDRFRMLGLTRRGGGQSDKPETGYDTDTLVEDVRQFLDAIKIKRVNLVGYSAGGNELTRFAGLYPKRTFKLVYLDAAYDRRDVAAIEAQDPLAFQSPDKPTKIQAALWKGQDEFRPDYKKIKAPALSFFAIFETHWDLKPDTDEASRKKAQEFIENLVQPYQWKNIEQFRKEMVKGKVVVLRDTHHAFFRDPKLKDEVVREMRQFLLSN
ncbi:MAG: alpha/beta hydrolase [Acidobacteriota bacterium]|nr:alpha/beta hydrolase [Acidobacteriota bacterium]